MNEFAKIKAHIKAKEEAQYQNELRNFRYKHPIATEEFYIKYRIRIIENLLVEYDKTADFTKSFDVEGIEIINGNPVCTKMGTATDYILLDTEVNLFKQRLINLSEPQKTNKPENDSKGNPYPLFFINENVYNKFKDYAKIHIIEPYTDYSYLKKRLENKNLIHGIKDNAFMKILFDDLKLISEKNYSNYLGKYESKLKSLKKSYSIQRENNFNNIFKGLI